MLCCIAETFKLVYLETDLPGGKKQWQNVDSIRNISRFALATKMEQQGAAFPFAESNP